MRHHGDTAEGFVIRAGDQPVAPVGDGQVKPEIGPEVLDVDRRAGERAVPDCRTS
ncbi:MAG: hypothetical protein AAF371_11460 [Pseudomonadota bacterium]